jgi:heparanase 1
MDISIDRNASIYGVVRPEFVSTTLDWWPLHTEAWDNSSVIHADLTHPNLKAAVRGLSPLFIRIGGSQADSAFYNMSDMSTITSDEATQMASACEERRELCLSMQRWDEVLKFAHDSGARIVFTLAYIRHTRDASGQNDQHDWDSTNARQLLQYTAQSKYASTVFGFELGNEVTHKGKVSNTTRLANAYVELRHIIDEVWSTTNDNHKPKILGPASTGKSKTANLLKVMGKHIDIATYHKYHGGGKDPAIVKYAKSPSIIQHPSNFYSIADATNKYMNDGSPEVWVGEGAMAYNSGRQNLTDSFVGSFWYVNLLGAISKSPHHTVYCRQALVGGYYELLSHDSMKARPDYWIAYLWKKLVGTVAIGPISSPHREDSPDEYTFGCCIRPGKDTLLVHAFCAKESRSNPMFIITNIDNQAPFQLNITVGTKITKYILTGEGGRRGSRRVVLNGKQVLTINDGKLPDIIGEDTHDLSVTLPPASIAFVVVHGFQVDECLQEEGGGGEVIEVAAVNHPETSFYEVQRLALSQVVGALLAFLAFMFVVRKRRQQSR